MYVRIESAEHFDNVLTQSSSELYDNEHTVTKFNTLLSAFEKLRKANTRFVMSVCLSVRPFVRMAGTTLLPLDGFSLNFKFEHFSKKKKNCPENSRFVKI